MYNPSLIPDGAFDQEVYQFNDIGVERALLACILADPRLILIAEREIPPAAFNTDLNQQVYRVMLHLSAEATRNQWPLRLDVLSILTVAQYLGGQIHNNFSLRTEGSEQLRGIEAMAAGNMVQPSSFREYAHRLLDRYRRTQLYRAAREHQRALLDFSRTPDVGASATLYTETVRQIAGKGSVGASPIGAESESFMLRSRLHDLVPRVNLDAFPSLMATFKGGYLPNESLAVICARSKAGKSYLCLNLAIDAFRRGLPVLYLDTELTRKEVYDRLIAALSGVHEGFIATGEWLTRPDAQKVHNAINELNAAGPRFKYRAIGSASVEQVQAEIRAFRDGLGVQLITDPATGQQHPFTPPALVIYDWLRLGDVSALKHAAEYQLLGAQVSALKQANAETGIPIIAAAQFNREAAGAKPADFDAAAEKFVSGSDRISHYCTCLAVLRDVTDAEAVDIAAAWGSRPGCFKSNALRFNQILRVQLNRHGAGHRSIPLYFARGFARYEDVGGQKNNAGVSVSDWLALPRREQRNTKAAEEDKTPLNL